MKILITCQFFNYCSGSATYVHDLAVELKARGHDVTILSQLGGEISNSALKQGIRIIDFSQIFEIQHETFDVLHLNQAGPAEFAIEFFSAPAVMTLHSSLGIEAPYVHKNIKKYIAAKPSEVETFKHLFPQLIHIGVPFDKFNRKNEDKIKADKKALGITKKVIAFIGSYDRLREKALNELITLGTEENFEVMFVGSNMLPYSPNCQKMTETFFIEKVTESADAISSILVGRTAIEAWACGKDYYCYDVDKDGNVKSMTVMPPPEDMHEYDIKYMTTKIEEVYKEAIELK